MLNEDEAHIIFDSEDNKEFIFCVLVRETSVSFAQNAILILMVIKSTFIKWSFDEKLNS